MGSGLVGAYRLRRALGGEVVGVALVVQMSPEVDGSAVHAVAAAQCNLAATVGADTRYVKSREIPKSLKSHNMNGRVIPETSNPKKFSFGVPI